MHISIRCCVFHVVPVISVLHCIRWTFISLSAWQEAKKIDCVKVFFCSKLSVILTVFLTL